MRKADNLPPSRAVVTKSGNLNFPEPSGPLQACNGTALPLKCVIIYLLASQHHLAEMLVYVWKFLSVVSVTKCQEQNRLFTGHTSYSKSLAVLQMYLSSSSCIKCVARLPLYLHFRLVEILAHSSDIPQLI